MAKLPFLCSLKLLPDVKPRVERIVDGYSGFLFLDKEGLPLVAMHWEHRFNHMVTRYNEIFRIQLPNITPHVCRHTYCSNMARSGMRREASPCRETPKRSSTSWGTAKSA